MTHSSPSSTADVFKLARSEPEFGSEKPWHQVIVPFKIPGRNCCLLLVGAPLEDRWADERVAEEVRAHRGVGLGELFVEDDLVHQA